MRLLVRLLALQLAVLVALGTELSQTSNAWAAPPAVVKPPAKTRDPETPAAPEPTPPTPPTKPDATPPSPQPPATNPAPGDGLVNTQPGFLAGVAVDPPGGKYQEGQKLVVRFQAEKEAHVYLLYYQADGQCLLLFPNQAHAESRVAAKSPVTIPAAGENFRFRVRSPFGEEAMQVLASAKPIDELEQLAKQASRGVPVSRSASIAEETHPGRAATIRRTPRPPAHLRGGETAAGTASSAARPKPGMQPVRQSGPRQGRCRIRSGGAIRQDVSREGRL